MHYRLLISEKARDELRSLDKATRGNIGFRLEAMRDDLSGDVKKLEAGNNRYRLRVGGYRILFILESDAIKVYAVKDRRDAYE